MALLLGTYSVAIAPELQRPRPVPHIPQRLSPRHRSTCCGGALRSGEPNGNLRPRLRGLVPPPLISFRQLRSPLASESRAGPRQPDGPPPINGPIWSIGSGGYWPFLDYGRLDALIDVQELRTHEFLVNYKTTILTAVAEVDDSIKGYRQRGRR